MGVVLGVLMVVEVEIEYGVLVVLIWCRMCWASMCALGKACWFTE